MRAFQFIASLSFGCAIVVGAAAAEGPTVTIQTEYLATLDVPLDPPQVALPRLVINLPPGATIHGPKIDGTSVAPGGDWPTVMPDGSLRLDVRGSYMTDDGIVFIEYNGIVVPTQEVTDRFNKGQTINDNEEYFIIAPRFKTESKKYAWLNHVQAVGKMVTFSSSHVKYDIFAVR